MDGALGRDEKWRDHVLYVMPAHGRKRAGQKGRDAPTIHQRSVRLVTERESFQEAHPPGPRTHTTNCKIGAYIPRIKTPPHPAAAVALSPSPPPIDA